MKSKVVKWGNSLAVRIPKVIADEINLAEDTSIDITMREGTLEIKPSAPSPVWKLEDLLAAVNPEALPGEWDTGEPQGGESL